jgi:RNA polymerase sigma-70 factor (ECF subfamily)
VRAYDELVTCYRARAVRIARSFLRDRDLAEDIAQEAFVRTFLSIKKLRAADAFLTYLTRTIVRLSIDYSRKSSSSEIAMDVDPPPAADSVPAEEVFYIQSILAQLSVKLRTVIVLRNVDGMDYASIARTLRLPIGTVRSRLSAARAAFKALYLSGEGGPR